MTVDYKVAGALGDIYKSHGVDVDSLAVQADDSAQVRCLPPPRRPSFGGLPADHPFETPRSTT